ncbi:MAG: organic hydroperoxide resistance protein OhrR [Solirubrobacteraceae bacterium]
MKPLYSIDAHVSGGRQGHASSPGLELELDTPTEMGGKGGAGTNPEQLFAAGYGACFLSALSLVARSQKISARQFTIDSTVALGQDEQGGLGLQVKLDCSLPGVEPDAAAELVRTAHSVCPYSKATHGNIEVELALDGQPLG